MKQTADNLQSHLRTVFKEAFRRDVGDGVVRVADIEEWDSLSHINLIMELEAEFQLDIDPNVVASLYTDSEAILQYLRNQGVTDE